MQTERITRDHVIELIMKMPLDKLAAWYEYGLFIQSRPRQLKVKEADNEISLTEEIAQWEDASDEDWLNFESRLEEKI